MELKELLESLINIEEEYNKTVKSFDLESKFKGKGKTKQEDDTIIKKIKQKIEDLKDGKASLEDLEELVKEYKK